MNDKLRSGQVDLAELQLTQFGNQEELYNFESLPYLADSYEEAMEWLLGAED